MLLQLAGNNVFFQLLPAVLVVRLHDFDNAVDGAVDAFQKHILQFHRILFSFSNQIKSAVIIVIHEFFK